MSTAEPSSRISVEEPLSSTDPGLVDDLAERIHTRVLTGEYAVGTWLRQEALAAEFGVSRTPVREALRKLQAARVVDVLPHRGALVRAPTATDIREAYLIRGELEGLAAEMAVARIDEQQLRRLRDAEEAFRQAMPALKKAAKAGGVEAIAGGAWDAANLGGAKRSREEPGGARSSQPQPRGSQGGARRSQGEPDKQTPSIQAAPCSLLHPQPRATCKA